MCGSVLCVAVCVSVCVCEHALCTVRVDGSSVVSVLVSPRSAGSGRRLNATLHFSASLPEKPIIHSFVQGCLHQLYLPCVLLRSPPPAPPSPSGRVPLEVDTVSPFDIFSDGLSDINQDSAL